LAEPYIYFAPEAGPPSQAEFGPVAVPPGQLWVMGDNRNDSADSRALDHFGPIQAAEIIGKTWIGYAVSVRDSVRRRLLLRARFASLAAGPVSYRAVAVSMGRPVRPGVITAAPREHGRVLRPGRGRHICDGQLWRRSVEPPPLAPCSI
jgi:hypothetical protein